MSCFAEYINVKRKNRKKIINKVGVGGRDGGRGRQGDVREWRRAPVMAVALGTESAVTTAAVTTAAVTTAAVTGDEDGGEGGWPPSIWFPAFFASWTLQLLKPSTFHVNELKHRIEAYPTGTRFKFIVEFKARICSAFKCQHLHARTSECVNVCVPWSTERAPECWVSASDQRALTFDKFIVALYNAKQCLKMRQSPAKPSQRGNATTFAENLTTPEQDQQISPERGLMVRSFNLSEYLYYPLDHHATYWPWSLSQHPIKPDLIWVNNAETPKNT
ncbi:hypothetical protein C8F04DRAFT_1191792 [Mycena alexandri]|uniref:Uncharacterized protein n=1 Tax=Mycena alexandri TaxID=1745969 RepID=A0AAD6SDQ6_9AGAR|nr:hypothetical protein C8F04DRAFT_1191792 [Mycena alexandri]